MLEPVVEMDVLLLDDLGAWKMTDWMNDTLFYILNSRYMAKRPTIITTNYQDVTREEALAADALRRREFLVERIGQRLRSRLMEMCLVVRMQGSDHRQARQPANQVALRGVADPRADPRLRLRRRGALLPFRRCHDAAAARGQRRAGPRAGARDALAGRAVGRAAGRERAAAASLAFLPLLFAGGPARLPARARAQRPVPEPGRRPVVGDRDASPPSATATSTR